MKRRVSVVLVFVLLVGGCTDIRPTQTATPAATPGATPTQAPSTTSPSQAPTDGVPSANPTVGPTSAPPSMDPELVAQINAVIASVPAVRELEATRDVPFEYMTREQFRAVVLELVQGDVPQSWSQAEERLYKRLGLMPADADMEALTVELYGTQVAAFYQPLNGHFYIIERDQPFGPSDKIIVSHEYTHALQDQHFDLEGTRIKDLAEGDAAYAQLAAIEGDASLTSQTWATENFAQDELFQLLLDALNELGNMNMEGIPLVMRRKLEFPYGEGLVFTQGLWESGGYAAVNASLETPPASTEQILHPEKYTAGEMPVLVSVSDASEALSEGNESWALVYQQAVGELGIQILATGGEEPAIAIPGLPVDWPHQEVAAGWGGDRLLMYEGPNDAWIIDWHTIWDTAEDATEFETRMNHLQGTFAGPMSVAGSGLERRVVIGSDPGRVNQLPR